ncbi:MAG: hypothetical protein HY508_05625 [Acidobacteria bacterium]|nr:hypothetical protein [Acidobacteriota bacterium]
MSVADDKIKNFEDAILLPALTDVSQSPRLLSEYTAEVVHRQPSADAAAEELILSLAGALDKTGGPSLVLTNREIPQGLSPLAGRYVMTVFYDIQGDEVYASPGVLFWMRFNNKLHVFNHRYDNDVAHHRIEDVKRSDIFNHILRSFDFHKIYAFSEEPFPGH